MLFRPPSSRRRVRRGANARRGMATVEFAFTAPIVFFMFMAMIEVARFQVLRHSVDEAIYMGARASVVPGATAAVAEQTVRDRISAAGFSGETVNITESVTSVTVEATVPYDTNSWIAPQLFHGVSVTRELTLDREPGAIPED